MSTAPNDTPKPPAPSMADHDALPEGTRFGEFEILSVLGVGGFGIVYLAHDHSLDRRVALKEYMPGSLASRGEGAMITVRSKSQQETYAIGLRSFVNEARLLARFDHPSLVKVYRFWEDNATAYMVMPYLVGVTLRDTRRAMSQAPDEAWIRSVVGPILGALEQLHREGVYHRDIAPDNVLLSKDGPPVLLDFGAARRVISDRTQSLTAILKPSYAPIEQYAEMTQMRQGPWTDLYALGAVIHYVLMGVPPAPATARAIQEDAEPIEQRRVAGVSPRFMEIVAWMLALRPNQRPQSVAALREVLDGHGPVPFNGSSTVPPKLPPAASTIGEATTLAITPHVPTEVVTTPHVMPSTALQSTAGFDTVAQPKEAAVGSPMQQTYAPSTPMPTARPMPTETTGVPVNQRLPAAAPRNTRPAALPPIPSGARAGATGADAGAGVIRQSHTGLWIFSGVAAVFFAILIGWSVMNGMSSRDAGDATASDVAASASAAASAAADALAKAQTPTTDPTPSTDGPATVMTTGDATAADAPTRPPGRAPTGTPVESSITTDASPASTTVVNPSTNVPPARIARTLPAVERPQPTGAAGTRPAATATQPSTQSTATTAGPDRSAPMVDRAPVNGRPATGSVGESALNAGSSLGTAASRARQPGSTVPPPSTRPAPPTQSPTQSAAQSQLLDQALTGRPVPTTTAPATSPLPALTAAAPTTAREACGKRVFIALAVCMDERCEEPRYRNGQECVKILETKRARENR